MLLQHAAAAGAHPLSGTVASLLWLLPLLPLLGFVVNGMLSLTSAFRFGPSDPGASHGEGDHHAHGAHAAHDTTVAVWCNRLDPGEHELLPSVGAARELIALAADG